MASGPGLGDFGLSLVSVFQQPQHLGWFGSAWVE
jgi:hypothetical protein